MRRLAAAAVVVVALAAFGSDDDATTPDSITTDTVQDAGPDATSATSAPSPDETSSDTGSGDTDTADGDYTEEDYVVAGMASLTMTDDDMKRCLTEATIDGVGFDEIQATGLAPDELFAQPLSESGLAIPEERREEIIDRVAGCGDLVTMYVEQGATIEAEKECADEHLTNEIVGEIFVTLLADDLPWSDELEAVAEDMETCIVENS